MKNKTFVEIGGLVAACLSWHFNRSVLWAIFHLLCGWLYVAFAVCKHWL